MKLNDQIRYSKSGKWFKNKEDFKQWYGLKPFPLKFYIIFLLNHCMLYKDIWYKDYVIWKLSNE